jgi:hypothetical protein
MTRVLYVCLATVLVAGAVFVAGCASEPVTTTRTITATATSTATETLPPESTTTTETITNTTTFLPQTTIPNQITEGITVAEALDMIVDNIDNPDFVLLDIRTPEERAVSYIEGSILLDWNAGDFEAEVESLDRCKTYLLY